MFCNTRFSFLLLLLLFSVVWASGDSVEAYGGEMRVSGRLEDFSIAEFQRSVAILLDSEVSDIYVLGAFSGVIVNFQIADPSKEELSLSSSTALTRLTGDKKMLLLYTWWVNDDPRLDKFPYSIISFVVYGEAASGGAYVVGQSTDTYTIHPSISDVTGDNGDQIVNISINISNSSSIFPSTKLLVFCLFGLIILLF